MPGAGTVQVKDVWLYVYLTNNAQPSSIFVGLYTDNGGAPQSLLSSSYITVSQAAVARAPLKTLSQTPLYLSAGNSYWIAVAPYLAAVDLGFKSSGHTPYYQGDPNALISSLPTVLGTAPATYVGTGNDLNPAQDFTMAAQLEYCQ